MYNVVDLFAGAGGLSLGFSQTGEFNIVVAFENNPAMQETYRSNHPNVDVKGDVCAADYDDIRQTHGDIDVVIGGPPCQGFSNANRQRNRAVNQNNMLVKQYIRAIQELQPKAFVMENVSMLKSEVHRFYLIKGEKRQIKKLKINTKDSRIELLDREAFFDTAEEIVKSKRSIKRDKWPDAHFYVMNIIYKASKNRDKLIEALKKHEKSLLEYAAIYESIQDEDTVSAENRRAFSAIRRYFDGHIDAERIEPEIRIAIKIQKMLKTAQEIHENNLDVEDYLREDGLCAIVKSYAVYDYINAVLGAKENGYAITDKVLCAADYGAPQKRNRFVVAGIKKEFAKEILLPEGPFSEKEYRTVEEAIKDLEDIEPYDDVNEEIENLGFPIHVADDKSPLGDLRDSDRLRNHIIPKTTDEALKRFKALKEGQNFHDLEENLKKNTYTDAGRTQKTIYLRLKYSEPCGTVVNVRKSMWIHPKKDRAISVREAARLQTFPDSFVFCGTKDKQYQQVGNAVPPIMARAIADQILSILDKGIVDKRNGR